MSRSLATLLFGLAMLFPSAAKAERVVLFAGGDDQSHDAPATRRQIIEPFGVEQNRDGEFYLVQMTTHRLAKIDRAGILRHIAGGPGQEDGGDRGDGGPPARAALNGPHALAIAPDGLVYIADTWNSRVRRFDPRDGTIQAFAGVGERGYAGDGGPAIEAKFGNVYCLAFNKDASRMLIADLDNRRIRAIDMRSGIVSTIAGNGESGSPVDGSLATESPLVDPRAVAVDNQGQVYIAERGGHALRVVDTSGRIRTVVGDGVAGLRGDIDESSVGGNAKVARLNGPKHLCADHDGNILIADTENHVIRRYLPRTGKIERVAGTGRRGSGGVGGPPRQVELDRPHGVYVAADATIYISDSSNNRILKIER